MPFIVIILLFIIFLLLMVILIPIIRFLQAVNKVGKKTREFFGGGDPDKKRSAATTATGKPKKIDPKVGEYVKFKELDVQRVVTDTSGQTYAVEQQVVDVEWEDIK